MASQSKICNGRLHQFNACQPADPTRAITHFRPK